MLRLPSRRGSSLRLFSLSSSLCYWPRWETFTVFRPRRPGWSTPAAPRPHAGGRRRSVEPRAVRELRPPTGGGAACGQTDPLRPSGTRRESNEDPTVAVTFSRSGRAGGSFRAAVTITASSTCCVPSGPVTASTRDARLRPFRCPRRLSASTLLCRDETGILKRLSRCVPALFFAIPISGGRDMRRMRHPGRRKTQRLEAPDHARWRLSPRDELGRPGLREASPSRAPALEGVFRKHERCQSGSSELPPVSRKGHRVTCMFSGVLGEKRGAY